MEKKKIVITFAQHGRRWFQDIAIAAARAFRELGHPCNVIACNKIDGLNGDDYDIVLVLAPHTYTELGHTPNFIKVPGKTYVAWCLEQTPHFDKTCNIMNKNWQRTLLYIDKFDFFFTESEPKTKFIIDQGRQCFTATIGYHEHFTNFNSEYEKGQKEYDVFFVGAMFPRRTKILTQLKERGLKIYPAARDFFDPIVKANAMIKCKVGLNIHHNDVGYFEKPRIIQDYMANKLLTVTETIDHPERFKNKKQLIMSDYDKIVDTVVKWCKKSQADRNEIVENAFHFISNHYTMKKALSEMIKTIEENGRKRIVINNKPNIRPSITDEATLAQRKTRYEFFHTMAMEKTVLDIACGTGDGTNILAKFANKTIGIDSDEEVIEHARATYMLPKFGVANPLKLPYGRNTMDVIFCFDFIERVSDYQTLLRECSRVLKRNGKLIISAVNKDIVSKDNDIPSNANHIKEWTLHELGQELSKHFYKVISYGQPNAAPWPVNMEAHESNLIFTYVCTK